MEEHAVGEDDSDGGDFHAAGGLTGLDAFRVGEGTDARFSDDVAVPGQLLHGLADGLPADAELSGQFHCCRNLYGFFFCFQRQRQNVASDFHIFSDLCGFSH